MQWLTAILAFAVTMLVFAIIVSTLVEMIHRIVRLRSQGMRLMLENLYERVIVPRLVAQNVANPPTAASFAATIMDNRAIANGSRPKGPVSRLIRWLVDAYEMTSIPVELFMQKLADAKVLTPADAASEVVLQDVAQKYEAFGQEISTFFERRARLFSVLVAFFVAWVFYVHPYDLAVAYLKNPELAQEIADRADETLEAHKELEEKLAQGASASELEAAIEELKQEFKNAQQQTAQLINIGVPVGWPGPSAELDYCFGSVPAGVAAAIPSGSGSPRSVPGDDDKVRAGFCRLNPDLFYVDWAAPRFGNILWLILGGLLIGLGAPFWVNVVTSLAAVRDVSKKIGEIVAPVQAPAAPPAPPATGGPPLAPAPAAVAPAAPKPTAIRTFEVARDA